MRSSRRWWLWNSVTKPHGRGAITRTPENSASFLSSPGILTFEKKRRRCYGRLRKIEEMINTHKEVPMKVIDLTHYIEPNILAYPGTEPPWTSSRRNSSWARCWSLTALRLPKERPSLWISLIAAGTKPCSPISFSSTLVGISAVGKTRILAITPA